MATTAIIDYGVGNLANLKNALDHLGVECVVVRDPEPLQTAERILFPGVGAFAPALERLRGSGMLDVLSERERLCSAFAWVRNSCSTRARRMASIPDLAGFPDGSSAFGMISRFHRSAGIRWSHGKPIRCWTG